VLAWRAVVRVLRSTARFPLDSITSVIFPSDCRVCERPLSGFSLLPVCDSCWNQLFPQTGVLCMCCGEALSAGAVPEGEVLCRFCRATAPPFEKAVAHGVYDGELRTLLHLLKYDGMEGLAERLGALAAEEVLRMPGLPESLVVTPVPLHGGKRRQRGFNQAELLARGAIAAMRRRRPGLHMRLAASALERRRATESQAGLTPHQRRENVRGAFFVAHPAEVQGRHVLLIDDIYTTGATARACSQALRAAGAESVRVATVARAQRPAVMGVASAAEPLLEPARDLAMEEDIAFWDGAGKQDGFGRLPEATQGNQ
jgi:ComF family protein